MDRKVYRLIEETTEDHAASTRGQAIAQKREHYRREEITPETILKSGDLLEVELTVESLNDYEYLLIEDFKAAGMETVNQNSGYGGNSLGAYMEYRDNRVALMLRWLPQGRASTAYRIRAEIPGRYSALPAVISGMYAPELHGNSDEVKIQIED